MTENKPMDLFIICIFTIITSLCFGVGMAALFPPISIDSTNGLLDGFNEAQAFEYPQTKKDEEEEKKREIRKKKYGVE